MRMIPSQPLGTGSNAEVRMFDQLRTAFSRPDQNGWFAMHSLNLPRHEYKRFGEIDFVICGPDGLFVLEVKGGGVSCHDGIWETANRYGEIERLRESPFKQAEGALHGLREKLPVPLSNIFVVGYGVVMPDVERLPDSAEWIVRFSRTAGTLGSSKSGWNDLSGTGVRRILARLPQPLHS